MISSIRFLCIGFTGTRAGMSLGQRVTVKALLEKIRPALVVHGDCLGSDSDFDYIAKEHGAEVRIRPCTIEEMRACCASLALAEPKAPMQRNRDIVADADALIACPLNYKRIKNGSGTWATIRFAERKGIPIFIVFPDGTHEVRGCSPEAEVP